MLQYPINVYPDKTAFAASDSNYYRGIQLTFKGDMLSSLWWRLYNYDTGSIVLENKIYGQQMRPICYNNGKVEIPNIFQSLGVGKYIMQFMLTQTRVDQSENNPNRINIHDRYVSRGKTTMPYITAQTNIYIEDEVNVIYEWNKNNDVYSASVIEEQVDTPNFTHRASEIIMKIGGETVPVVSYDASTGKIVLANTLQNNYPRSTPYELYANYLISELYYFEVAYQPELQPTAEDENHNPVWVEWGAYGGTFRGFFWQGDTRYDTQGGTMIKYYTYDLLKVDEENQDWEIFKSDKIFSQNVTIEFVDDYDDMALSGYHYMGEVETYDDLPEDAEIKDVYLNLWNSTYYMMTENGWDELDECGGNYKNRRYKMNVHCALQNGMELDKSVQFQSPERVGNDLYPYIFTYDTVADESNNHTVVNILGGHVTGALRFRIYRANESANKYYYAPYKELIADIRALNFTDYIAGTHEKYRYMIVPYDKMSGLVYPTLVTDIIENNFSGYTITALHDTGKVFYGKPLYLAGENWKLMAEIEDTENVQNLNRVTHVGNGRYATVTATENNYMSGSLTAELGRMNCAEKTFKNDASVMAEWREFISQDCPFILRNQKGDVWLVRITDGGSISYGEDARQIDSKVTFSWVECGSVYDYLIQSEDITGR